MKIFSLGKDGLLSKSDRDEIVSILNTNGLVVVPTDTSYGLAARIDKKAALKKLYRVKGRMPGKTLSMVVSGRVQANVYGVISCKPTALWKAFLPGPLTLVVWARKKLLPEIVRKDKTVAIRHIPTPSVNQVLRAVKVPLTITSANRGGKSDVYSRQAFLKQYKNGKLPEAFIDAGPLKKRRPSTVVSVKKGEEVFVLRKGSISSEAILKAIEKH